MLDFVLLYLAGAMVAFPFITRAATDEGIRKEGVKFFVVGSFVLALLIWWIVPASKICKGVHRAIAGSTRSAQA